MPEDRHIQVIDYSLGKRDSEEVDTKLPFSQNYAKAKTLQDGMIVMASYVNLNYLDNFKYKSDITVLYNKLENVNINISNIESYLLDNDFNINEINGYITALNGLVANINSELSNIDSTIYDMDTNLNLVNDEISNIETDILNIINDIDKLYNLNKFLIGIDDGNAKIKLNLTNELEENMIINVKVPITLTGDISQLSIDNGLTYKEIRVNNNIMSGSVLRNKYLTFRYDGFYWISDDLTSRVFKIETNGIIGATQYGGTLVSNLDNIIKSGFYTAYGSATGVPTTDSSYWIIHENSNVGNITATQTAKAYVSGEPIIYVRNKIGSVWGSWYLIPKRSDIEKLDNKTKFITATAVTNGDFKINVTNELVSGLILNVSFPVAPVLTANSRLSIDNGVTFKNVFIDEIPSIAKSLKNKNLILRYDGTRWQIKENVYSSTTETIIGTWIDGKPIYRKVYIGSIPSGASYLYCSQPNVDRIVNIGGNVKTSSVILAIPFQNNDTTYTCSLHYNIAAQSFYLQYNTNMSGGTFELSVEYTKTTD